MTDRELLQAILYGTRLDEMAGVTADQLLKDFGSLTGVIAASPSDLARGRSLGYADILRIRAIHTVAMRLCRSELDRRSILADYEKVTRYLMTVLARETREHYRVLYLNGRNRLLADELVACGTTNYVVVYPREIIRRSLELHATALILVHNDPSGTLVPSESDLAVTNLVVAAAGTVSIVVHDHIIVAREGWVSLRDLRLMPRRETAPRQALLAP
jgi:DNA repair protein RadC